MSAAAAVTDDLVGEIQGVFTSGLDDEIRNIMWGHLMVVLAAPDFSDIERRYARQLSSVLDAIDLGGDVSREIKGLTWGALAWAKILLEEMARAQSK